MAEHYGYGKTGGGSFMALGETPRERLIVALTAAMTRDQADCVVDALETYLEEGPGNSMLTLPIQLPNYTRDLNKMRVERDAAVKIAEQALSQMQETLDRIKGGAPPEPEGKIE